MTPEELNELKQYLTPEKQWVNDNYYRLRKVENGYEIAKLQSDACGASVVNPQIKLEQRDGYYQPVQLIDLQVSPTKFIEYSAETKEELDEALNSLIQDFKTSYQGQK